jgi:hypothetical protein
VGNQGLKKQKPRSGLFLPGLLFRQLHFLQKPKDRKRLLAIALTATAALMRIIVFTATIASAAALMFLYISGVSVIL